MRLIDADAMRESIRVEVQGAESLALKHELQKWVDDQPTVCDWISVKDRLPEHVGRYLCYAGDHPLGGFCYIINFNPDAKEFWSYERNMSVSFITHWMPLPEPPEEVSVGAN